MVTRGGGLVVFTGDHVDAGPLPVPSPRRGWVWGRWRGRRPDAPRHPGGSSAGTRNTRSSAPLRTPSAATCGGRRSRGSPGSRPTRQHASWPGSAVECRRCSSRPLGRGRVLWFASACDRDWGDWPRGRMFLPMVHQMIAEAAGIADGGRVRPEQAGETTTPGITLRRRDLPGRQRRPVRVGDRALHSARVRRPFRLPPGESRPDPRRPARGPAPPTAGSAMTRSGPGWPWA